MVATPKVGNVSGASSTGIPSLTTPAQTVDSDSGLYVQVAMYGSSLSQPTVADAQGGVYTLVQGGHNGSVYLWVFRRSGTLTSSSNFTVTVTPSSSSAPIEVVAIEVLNHGETDAYSGLQTGTGTSETSSVSTTIRNDIVLFLGADHSATFSSWGSGQTGISGYPTPPTNVTAWGSYQAQGATGSASSSRAVTASTTWIAVSIAVAPQTPWFSIGGKPFVTVSPIGQTTMPEGTVLVNNGADFGPDTTGTTTTGVQEAISSLQGTDSVGGTVALLPGQFSVGSQITVTGNDIRIVGTGGAFNSVSGTTQGASILDTRGSSSGKSLFLIQAASGNLWGFELEGVNIAGQNYQGLGTAALEFDSCQFCRVVDCNIWGTAYDLGILINGCAGVFLSDLRMVNANSELVEIYASADVFFDRSFLVINQGSASGILIEDCPNGPIYLCDLDITTAGLPTRMATSLAIQCSSNDCAYIYADRCHFDSAALNCVSIATSTGHAAQSIRFHACYMVGCSQWGVNAAGDLKDISFVDCIIGNNGYDGIQLSPSSTIHKEGIALIGNSIDHNGTRAANTYSGIDIASDGDYRIEGNFIGNGDKWGTTAYQGWAINNAVSPASSSRWVIIGNSMLNNSQGAFKNSITGITQIITAGTNATDGNPI